MKKNSLTSLIIFAGIAAAVCMLCHAFLPAVYNVVACPLFMFVVLGAALFLTPEKKPTVKSFVSVLATLLVAGIVAWVFDKIGSISFAKLPVLAVIAGVGMIIAKQEDYALSTALCSALFAAAPSIYSEGKLVAYLLTALAFAVFSSALNIRKIKGVPARIAAIVLFCLAFCAFK